MSKILFALRETYPGSPPLGTIVEFNEQRKLFFYDSTLNVRSYIPKKWVEDFDHWAPFLDIPSSIPIGSYVVYNTGPNRDKIYYAERTMIRDGRPHMVFKGVSMGLGSIVQLSLLNLVTNNGGLQYFETEQEAWEYLFEITRCLSLEDVESVYSTASNPNFSQYKELRKLIKLKLNNNETS